MIRLAFKVADVAAAQARAKASALPLLSPERLALDAGAEFSLAIARVTGGEYSHVEIWFRGPITAAECFSSREPDGTGFATIDLSDATLWTIVEIPYTFGIDILRQDEADYAWMQGRSGRRYNFIGIPGIALGQPLTDPHDDFCSQCGFEFLQDRRGMFPGWDKTEWISPSGDGKDGKRFGLIELVKGEQKLP